MSSDGGYVDKQLTCVECHTVFTFTAKAQERFAELGFTNEPRRCPPCRAARKAAATARTAGASGEDYRRSYRDSADVQREFHVTICGSCGGEARVPFKPRGDRPIYCSACFDKVSRR
jgi:CxxC-x17-CxxC domain-containing protein